MWSPYVLVGLVFAFAEAENFLRPPQADFSYSNVSLGAFGRDLDGRSLLFERQRRCLNPAYVPCSNIPGKCCPPGDNCRADLGKCCPPQAETCRGRGCWEPGSVCCATGQTCQPGDSCCLNSCCQGGFTCCPQAARCCSPGSVCCPGACCPEGSQCGSQYGLCRTRRPNTSRQTTTTSSTTTRSTTTAPVQPKTTQSQPKISTPKEPETSTTEPPSSQAPTSTTTNTCQTPNPSPTGEALANLPVVEFLYYPGYDFLNDIVRSVCLGIRSRGKRGNFDILTKGEGASNKCYHQRRRGGNCGGCCTGVKKDEGVFQFDTDGNPQVTECDEYPFVSTAEGGAGAHRSCVVSFQNAYQGSELKRQYAKYRIRLGDSFGVRVVGLDCDMVKESDLQGCQGVRSDKRQLRENVLKQGTSSFVIPAANGTDGKNTLVISLGELRSGKYGSFAKLISGQVQDLSVISNSGEELTTALSLEQLATQGQQLDFELEEDEFGVGIVASTNDAQVNMSYTFTSRDEAVSSIVPSTSLAVAPTTTTGTSAGVQQGGSGFGTLVLITALWLLFF